MLGTEDVEFGIAEMGLTGMGCRWYPQLRRAEKGRNGGQVVRSNLTRAQSRYSEGVEMNTGWKDGWGLH